MQVSERQAVSILRRGRRDPVWFVEAILGQQPTEYQSEWLEAVRDHSRVAIATCHGTGKSKFAGGMVVPWYMMCHPLSEVVTTAPTYRQVVRILWKEIRRAKNEAKINLGGRLTKTEWILDSKADGTTDWFAMGFTAPKDDPDRFVGLHSKSGNNLVVVDEAAGVSETIFDEGIASIMSSAGSKALLIGNPTSISGEFRSAFKRDSPYCTFSKSAFETPNFQKFGITLADLKSGEWKAKVGKKVMPHPHLVTPDWAADRLRKWGPEHPLFLARVRAMFPNAGESSLIGQWAIDAACERELPVTNDFRWGVDVGGEGPDPSIVGRADASGRYRKIYQEGKTRLVALAGRIAITARERKHKPLAINIDNEGLGLAVYQELRDALIWDEIRDRRVPICKAQGSLAARDKVAFINRRAEIYWNLRRLFEEGLVDIDPRDEDLIEELQQIRWKVGSGGRVQIESKREYKARVGRSPDNADTMAYSFAQLSEFDFVTFSM